MNPAIIAAVNNHYPVYSPTTTATIQNTINNKLAIVFLINSILAILPLYGINNIDALSIVSSKSFSCKPLPVTKFISLIFFKAERLSNPLLQMLYSTIIDVGGISSGTK